MTATAATSVASMTDAEREVFERDGYLVIRRALSPDEVARYEDALDRVHARERAAGRVVAGAAMHVLGAVAHAPEIVGLVDHPATFRYVWSILGWNAHISHSHLDVHPTVAGSRPYRFEWHQDGGRQNRELETDPRPRLSVKLVYWLSDVSQPGRGNFRVVPGSHLTNRIDGPARRDMPWPDPNGAVDVCAAPGDVVFFDRRLWHARTDNHSPITRKAAFFAYAHRWQVGRDENEALLRSHAALRFSPVQRQLLGDRLAGPGEAEGDHRWGHHPHSTPVYGYLRDRGLLDQAFPPLIP